MFLISAGHPPSSSKYSGSTVANTFSNVNEPSSDFLLVIVHSRDKAWLKRTVKEGSPASFLDVVLTSIIAMFMRVSERLVTVADFQTDLNFE
jgi:hypothetical protein